MPTLLWNLWMSDIRFSYPGKDLEAMSFAENYHAWIRDEITPFLGDRVAEIGAGSGNFSQMLLETPLKELKSFEPSGQMFPILAQNFERFAHAKCTNDFYGNCAQDHQEYFDTVCYINVLEHIEHDLEELKIAYSTLKKGGRLVIFVPALMSLMSDFDRSIGHFRRYHKAPLQKLIEDAGFKVIKNHYFDSLGVFPWWLVFVKLRKNLQGSNVSAYDKFVIPFLRKLEKIFTPPFGKNLLCVAIKE